MVGLAQTVSRPVELERVTEYLVRGIMMHCSRQDSVATPVDTETPRCQVSKKSRTLTLEFNPLFSFLASHRLSSGRCSARKSPIRAFTSFYLVVDLVARQRSQYLDLCSTSQPPS